MQPNLINLMQKLGFRNEVAQIYKFLLQNSPVDPRNLLVICNQDQQFLKDTLDFLLSIHLIGQHHVRGKVRYYARAPEITWAALESRLIWERDNSLKPVREVFSTGDQHDDRLRTICIDIVPFAQQIYKPYHGALTHREREANTPDELTRLTCELIYDAKSNIYAVSKSPRLPHVAEFWSVLLKRIKDAGVTYKRIVDLDEIVDHGLKVVTRDINEIGIDLRVIEKSKISSSYYIVDKRWLSVQYAVSKSNNYIGKITSQTQKIGRYFKKFKKYYDGSIPGEFAVAHLRNASNELLSNLPQKFSSTEIQWLKSLIDMGKFSTFHKTNGWTQEEFYQVKEKAIVHQVVNLNHDGIPVLNYPTNENLLREAYTSFKVP